MARVYSPRYGQSLSKLEPMAELSLATCEERFKLDLAEHHSCTSPIYRLDPNLESVAAREGYADPGGSVVVELMADEVIGTGWRPGFYRLPTSRADALALIRSCHTATPS